MGTSWSIKFVTAEDVDLAVRSAVESELSRFDLCFSTYNEASEISRFNRHLSREPFAASAEFLAMVRLALEIARNIATNSAPISVAITKRMIWENLGVPDPASVMKREGPLFSWIGSQPDAREGVVSFVEKREPAWTMKPSKDMPDMPPPEG